MPASVFQCWTDKAGVFCSRIFGLVPLVKFLLTILTVLVPYFCT